MKLLKQAHTVYQTQYHIVWVTRYRRKILVQGLDQYLKKILEGVKKFFPDVWISEIGIDQDHVHIHVVIPPKYAVATIVSAIKSNTSRLMRKKFQHFLSKVYWDEGGIWGSGYFVSTVGLNKKTIRAYVRQQGQHDAGQLAELK